MYILHIGSILHRQVAELRGTVCLYCHYCSPLSSPLPPSSYSPLPSPLHSPLHFLLLLFSPPLSYPLPSPLLSTSPPLSSPIHFPLLLFSPPLSSPPPIPFSLLLSPPLSRRSPPWQSQHTTWPVPMKTQSHKPTLSPLPTRPSSRNWSRPLTGIYRGGGGARKRK